MGLRDQSATGGFSLADWGQTTLIHFYAQPQRNPECIPYLSCTLNSSLSLFSCFLPCLILPSSSNVDTKELCGEYSPSRGHGVLEGCLKTLKKQYQLLSQWDKQLLSLDQKFEK